MRSRALASNKSARCCRACASVGMSSKPLARASARTARMRAARATRPDGERGRCCPLRDSYLPDTRDETPSSALGLSLIHI
eukprot:2599233-Alexandrium_andersonii.AAC.1